jgi:hypothetical protein
MPSTSTSPENSECNRWWSRRVTVLGPIGLAVAAWLWSAPAQATLYHVDVTGTFSLAVSPFTPPFPAFSGSFDLDPDAAPIQHIVFPGSFPVENLNLSMYQAAALSAVNFHVGSTTFTSADLVDLSTIYTGQPSGVLYSSHDLVPGGLDDIVLAFNNGTSILSVGFVFCLTLSTTACNLDNETDFTEGGSLAYRAFDTAVTITGPATATPEPSVLSLFLFGIGLVGLFRTGYFAKARFL